MDYIDYYKVLGVAKSASDKDIKKAFKKLARKYHPDLNPDDKEAEKRFKEINEANEVLSKPENRKKYDQYGKDWKHAEQFEQAKQSQRQSRRSGGSQYRGSYSQSDFGGEDFSDFFGSMFGGSGGRRSQNVKFRGQDYNAELHLDLKAVYTSHQKTLTVNGKNIRITIPAGVENGQTIKIKGHGGPGRNNGPKGDLYLKFIINNNTNFRRDKSHLHLTVEVDLYTAVLGGEITVDTLDGKVKLKVKPETQNGTKVKLKGKGFPVYKKEKQFGDLFLTYQVKIPQNLTKEQKDLFKALRSLNK